MRSELIGKVRRVVRRRMAGGRGSHGFDHVKRVLATSLRLGRESGADLEVLTLAALLHDIGRPEEDRSEGRRCHARAGAEEAAELLRRNGAPPALVRRVCDCVRQHRYRGDEPPLSLEAKLPTISTPSAPSVSAGPFFSPERSAPPCTTAPRRPGRRPPTRRATRPTGSTWSSSATCPAG